MLQVHNLYQLPGGEDRVVEDERALLESRGHRVFTHVVHNDAVQGHGKLALAARSVWSRTSAAALRALCREHRPDVAHFHNTLPLVSPSGYYAVRREGAAVVQTLHNYRLLCPVATCYRDGSICEDCVGKPVKWPAVKHGCYRGSRAASAAVAGVLAVHGALGTYRREVDAYIACSDFMREKMIEGGIAAERIVTKPNFVPDDPGAGDGSGGYALYLGRLVEDKGLGVLIEAWERLAASGGEVPALRVVGKGPMADAVRSLADRVPAVTYRDWVGQPELGELLGRAGFLVLPTLNYEGFPKVIVEAYAHGVPVVTSSMGSAGSVVAEGETGRRVAMGDAAELAAVCWELAGDAAQRARLRAGARQAYETHYTADVNHDQLIAVYRGAVAQRDAVPAVVPRHDPA